LNVRQYSICLSFKNHLEHSLIVFVFNLEFESLQNSSICQQTTQLLIKPLVHAYTLHLVKFYMHIRLSYNMSNKFVWKSTFSVWVLMNILGALMVFDSYIHVYRTRTSLFC